MLMLGMASPLAVGDVWVVANLLISRVAERRCSHSLALLFSVKLNIITRSSPAGSQKKKKMDQQNFKRALSMDNGPSVR